MAKTKKKGKKPSASPKATPDALASRARDIWLAGLGALDRARKDGTEHFDVLVSHGEALRGEAGETVDAALARLEHAWQQATAPAKKAGKKARKAAAGAGAAVEARIEEAVETVLHKVGVPSRDEVTALTAQVHALEARLAERTGTAGRPSAGSPAVVRVAPQAEGWAVARDGKAKAESRHGTKKEALVAARLLARAHAPSRLVVLRADGSEQETVEYAA